MFEPNDLNDARERINTVQSLLDRLATFKNAHPEDVKSTVNVVRGELVKLDADLHRFVTGR